MEIKGLTREEKKQTIGGGNSGSEIRSYTFIWGGDSMTSACTNPPPTPAPQFITTMINNLIKDLNKRLGKK